MRLWLRLFDAGGAILATWEQALPADAAGFTIDSAEVRARFDLPAFSGQLFIHAIGVAGHDVVKYALDTYRPDAGGTADTGLSVTHDANAWPSDRYAGLPAPNADERVMLWVQNSHAAPIPPGAITLNRMGCDEAVALTREVAPFASVAVDVASLLPGVLWPAQIELRTGRHVVRPRYEIYRGAHTRIAHVNVERADLLPDPGFGRSPTFSGGAISCRFPFWRRRISARSCSRTRCGAADDVADPAGCVHRGRAAGGAAFSGQFAARPQSGAGSGRAGGGGRACGAGV